MLKRNLKKIEINSSNCVCTHTSRLRKHNVIEVSLKQNPESTQNSLISTTPWKKN